MYVTRRAKKKKYFQQYKTKNILAENEKNNIFRKKTNFKVIFLSSLQFIKGEHGPVDSKLFATV